MQLTSFDSPVLSWQKHIKRLLFYLRYWRQLIELKMFRYLKRYTYFVY